MQRGLIILQDR